MKLCTCFALFFGFSLFLFGQTNSSKPAAPRTIEESLAFSPQPDGTTPMGWSVNPPATIHLDKQIVHSGQWSVRFDRNSSSDGRFSVMTHSIPVDFVGTEVELRGFMRTRDIAGGYAGLWMREDGNGRMIKLENMAAQHVDGTRDWAEYSIKLPIDRTAQQLFLGALLEGTGTMWVDDLRLLVDGKPIERPLTALDSDHVFDNGSKLHISALSQEQVGNLVTLGRVWGFLKYHHPEVTEGKHHWDYELLRLLPLVLAAPDAAHENEILVRWIDSLGEIPDCPAEECTQSPDTVYLKPDIDWIRDRATLGSSLSLRLQRIYQSRPHRYQFYVSIPFYPSARNASFNHEPFYQNIDFPDPGFQLLALFRWWNIMQYWAPYRVDAGQNWTAVIAEFIPKIALAKDRTAYQLAMMELIAKANDTHANLWSSLSVRPPVGSCALPVHIRFVDGQAVITGSAKDDDAALDSRIHLGDVIDSLDGKSIATLTEEWTPYYADSNVAARRRDMARFLTHGVCGRVSIGVIRDGKPVQLHLERQPLPKTPDPEWHDLPGETFRLLSPDVAYLKLSSIKATDIPQYMERAANTKGLIVDIRNYPSEFVPFALGQYLVTRPTDFAAVTIPDLGNPGTFHFDHGDTIQPGPTHYRGKVVILVDEVSQSSAEYTTMALRSSPNAIVVGSMTAGADGNVSQIPLPGGLSTMISGIGVFYPDQRPTQRIGIVPDVEAKPSVAGIKARRDEVLEVAIRKILGSGVSENEIERLAKPHGSGTPASR